MAFQIDWSSFWPDSHSEMQDDHDMIVLTITRNVIGVSGVRVVMDRAPNVTWWKGFALISAQGAQVHGVTGSVDSEPPAEREFTMAELQGARLELWKAKFLGVHTHTYTITDLSALTPGTLIEFRWVQDTGGVRNAEFVSANFSNVTSQDNQVRSLVVSTGTAFQLETRVMNRGSTIAFDPVLAFNIGSQNPQDNQTWGTDRWGLPGIIAPNDGLNVTLSLRAPAAPGNYTLALRMVQDGTAWFGDTFTYLVTVPGPGTPGVPPGRTCLLTGLAVGLSMLGSNQDELLDGARQLRAQLQQTPAGTRLMQVYAEISRTGELETLILEDPRLQWQCLTFACNVVDATSGTSRPGQRLTDPELLAEFLPLIDTLHSRSSTATQQQLEEVRNLLAESLV